MAETPFGGTIAHGFLTLSLISALAEEVMPAPVGLTAAMLVSVDRVKFISPLRAGKRIRGDFVLDRLVWAAKDRAFMKVRVVLEIEDQAEPALTCDVCWILLFGEAFAGPTNEKAGAGLQLDRV
jgi:acyl dehydratase